MQVAPVVVAAPHSSRQQRVAPQVTAAVMAVMAVTAKKAKACWRDTMVNASARVVAAARHVPSTSRHEMKRRRVADDGSPSSACLCNSMHK